MFMLCLAPRVGFASRKASKRSENIIVPLLIFGRTKVLRFVTTLHVDKSGAYGSNPPPRNTSENEKHPQGVPSFSKTPRVGFEPTTNPLTAGRSTTELPRNN